MGKHTDKFIFVLSLFSFFALSNNALIHAQKGTALEENFGILNLSQKNQKLGRDCLNQDLNVDIQNEDLGSLLSMIGLKVRGLNIEWRSVSGKVPALTIQKKMKLQELLIFLKSYLNAKIHFNEEGMSLRLLIEIP